MKTNSLGNQLLARLPQSQYGELLSRLRPVLLKSGQVVHEPRAPVEHAYSRPPEHFQPWSCYRPAI